MTDKPMITGTRHTLPYEKLDPLTFEKLCLGLIKLEGFEDAEHLGAAGGEQGRDIRAWKDGQQIIFQCKRVEKFGPTDAKKEVQKLLDLPLEERPEKVIFLITRDVSVQTRDAARRLAETGGIECAFWSLTELDEKVSRHKDLVNRYFGFPEEQEPNLWNDIPRYLSDYFSYLPSFARHPITTVREFSGLGRVSFKLMWFAVFGVFLSIGISLILSGFLTASGLTYEDEGFAASFLRSFHPVLLPFLAAAAVFILAAAFELMSRSATILEVFLKFLLADRDDPDQRSMIKRAGRFYLKGSALDTINASFAFAGFIIPVWTLVFSLFITGTLLVPENALILIAAGAVLAGLTWAYFLAALSGAHPNTTLSEAALGVGSIFFVAGVLGLGRDIIGSTLAALADDPSILIWKAISAASVPLILLLFFLWSGIRRRSWNSEAIRNAVVIVLVCAAAGFFIPVVYAPWVNYAGCPTVLILLFLLVLLGIQRQSKKQT